MKVKNLPNKGHVSNGFLPYVSDHAPKNKDSNAGTIYSTTVFTVKTRLT